MIRESHDVSTSSPSADLHPLRVLLADDHEMILDIFGMYLAQTAGMKVSTAISMGGAEDLLIAEGPFDVVLLDLNMPA
jgi:DNA-binding NarL/FixJ family response regulator